MILSICERKVSTEHYWKILLFQFAILIWAVVILEIY